MTLTQRVASAIVVESLPLCRDGFVRFLRKGLDLRVLASTAALAEGLQLAQVRRPDMIVLGRDAPRGDVFIIARSIRSVSPSSRIVLTAAEFTGDDFDRAARERVHACLLKTAETGELSAAFRSVIGSRRRHSAGTPKRPRSPSVRCGNGNGVCPPEALKSLTERELEVLRYVARGLTVIEISKKLHSSCKTVDGHKTSLMAKLGIHDRVVLARFAIREGLIPVWEE